MKKLVLVASFLLSIVIYNSCDSKKSCDCEADYTFTNLKIQNQSVRFKDYNSKVGQRYLEPVSKEGLDLKPINDNMFSRSNYQLVAEFYLIDGDRYQISENDAITSDMISGILSYYKEPNNDQLYATLLKHYNGTYESTHIDMLKTNAILTNDVYGIAKKYLDINNCTVFAYLGNLTQTDTDIVEYSELQYAAYKEVRPTCSTPCPSGYGACNPTTQECFGVSIPICKIKQADSIIHENGLSNNYPFVNILATSRAFRDNYMAKHKGSIQLIDFYYKGSKDIKQHLDLELAIDTYHIMRDYLPKMSMIMNNPNDNQQILISPQDRDRIISFLNKINNYLTDNELKSKLQVIISLTNELTNKTNHEITQRLDQPVFMD